MLCVSYTRRLTREGRMFELKLLFAHILVGVLAISSSKNTITLHLSAKDASMNDALSRLEYRSHVGLANICNTNSRYSAQLSSHVVGVEINIACDGDVVVSVDIAHKDTLHALAVFVDVSALATQHTPSTLYIIFDLGAQHSRERRTSSYPVFVSPSSNTITLPETLLWGATAATIVATSPLNKTISYSIISPSPSPFLIGSANGVVVLNSTITHDPYSVLVCASDSSTPALRTYQEFIFQMETLNYPYLLGPNGSRADSISATVMRNATTGSVVVALTPFDDNATVTMLRFSLTCSGSASTYVNINTSSGVVTVAADLNAIPLTALTCSVFVWDSTRPSRNSTTPLYILPLARVVRVSVSLCGVSNATALSATPALLSSFTNAAFITSTRVSVLNVLPFSWLACVGSVVQYQAYCYEPAECTAFSTSISSQSFLLNFKNNLTAASSSIASALTSVALLTNVTVYDTLASQPPITRAPQATAANSGMFFAGYADGIRAGTVANTTGRDLDLSTLTIAVISVDNRLGTWGYQDSNAVYVGPITVGVSSVFAIPAAYRIVFNSTAGQHGVSSIQYQLIKAATITTPMLLPLATQPYDILGPDTLTLVTVINPAHATSPSVSSNNFTAGPITRRPALQGTSLYVGWPVATLLSTSTVTLPVDAVVPNLLTAAGPTMLALVPAQAQALYTQTVDYVNSITASRTTVLASGHTAGLAITSVPSVSGVWEYSLAPCGCVWSSVALAAPSATSALLLPSTAFIRFVPSPTGPINSATLSFTIWDSSQGAPGSTTDPTRYAGSFGAAAITLTVAVNTINSRPTAFVSSYQLPAVPYVITEPRVSVVTFTLQLSWANATAQRSLFLDSISLVTTTTAVLITMRNVSSK